MRVSSTATTGYRIRSSPRDMVGAPGLATRCPLSVVRTLDGLVSRASASASTVGPARVGFADACAISSSHRALRPVPRPLHPVRPVRSRAEILLHPLPTARPTAPATRRRSALSSQPGGQRGRTRQAAGATTKAPSSVNCHRSGFTSDARDGHRPVAPDRARDPRGRRGGHGGFG